MGTKKRVVIGAIGGIMPYIVTLLVIDFQAYFTDFNKFDFLGLFVRCLVLIFLGAFVAYLNQSETEPFKVFQLGLWAPALVATAINGYSQPSTTYASKKIQPASIVSEVPDEQTYFLPSIATAYASNGQAEKKNSEKYRNASYLRVSKVSGFDRFLRGLFGRKIRNDTNNWFVISGSHKNAQDAQSQAEDLKNKGYLAKVYPPFFGSKYYAVVIGSNISLPEAQTLKKQAIKDGLPEDTYLWSR